MSPRMPPSRHAMLYPGPYAALHAQPALTHNVPYSPHTGDALDDSARHYALSSAGPRRRIRHDQAPSWNNSNKSFLTDQAPYSERSQSSQGPFTMNPADAIYPQTMMTGYEASAPLDTTANMFNPMVVTPPGRYQVSNEQDMIQDSVLPLGMDFEYLPNGAGPYSRNTEWIHGQPSPVGSECMLVNRHGASVTESMDMMRDTSPYELVDNDQYLRHSDTKYAPVQPRPLRSASDRRDSSSDDSYHGKTTRHSEHGQENKKPRSDPYYNTGPGPDGWYRCPFFNTIQDCNHKPTKQKCIFDKNLDSHLKPYKCTEPDCEDSSFSSNACLFRHQREAHGHHGHSAHLCHWTGCERAQPGNGFPRKWNLGDHMKRVHAYDMTKDSGDDSSRKRRHASSAVPMKRSTSSKDKVFPAALAPHPRVDRHAAKYSQQQTYSPLSVYEGCNATFPYQDFGNMVYSQHTRHSQPLVSY